MVFMIDARASLNIAQLCRYGETFHRARWRSRRDVRLHKLIMKIIDIAAPQKNGDREDGRRWLAGGAIFVYQCSRRYRQHQKLSQG